MKIRGFTLLELLVVIIIIGLLTAVVGPRYFSQLGKSEQSVAKAQIDAFSKALESYRLDMGQYPSNEQGLQALFERPGGSIRWSGPYLQKAPPQDPWSRPYIYRSPGANGSDYDLITLGKDGQIGGTQENADVSYR